MKNLARILFVAVFVLLPSASVGQTFTVNMSGGQEAPSPGDPDGSGVAALGIIGNTITYTISVQGLTMPPIAQHIHTGGPGQQGPVLVGLPGTWAGNTLTGSVTTTPDRIAAIVANPGAFYVNVHTTDFVVGAVRGQLVLSGGAIPTTSDWGLMLITIALAAAGVASLRRV